jgi:hypothetical protein
MGASVRRAVRRLAYALLAVAGISSMGWSQPGQRAGSAALPVRFAEGTVHGILVLSTAAGALLARSGAYVINASSHNDGSTADTLPAVAFTPKPHIIKLELAPSGTQAVFFGKHEATAMHIALKPRLGTVLRFFAGLRGRLPDSHPWIVADHVPALVRYQGPTLSSPVWQVDLASSTRGQ